MINNLNQCRKDIMLKSARFLILALTIIVNQHKHSSAVKQLYSATVYVLH